MLEWFIRTLKSVILPITNPTDPEFEPDKFLVIPSLSTTAKGDGYHRT